ncbi:MAG: hypothetical protein NTX00_00340 [Candidatus Parcubacteria bacterium]|nr:hypothetical protein [Candidatus Parcubacteria bacterium]
MEAFKKIGNYLKKDVDEISILRKTGNFLSVIFGLSIGLILILIYLAIIIPLAGGAFLSIAFIYILIIGVLATPIIYLSKLLPYNHMPHALYWLIIAVAILLLIIVSSIILPPATTTRDSLSEDDENYDPRQGW